MWELLYTLSLSKVLMITETSIIDVSGSLYALLPKQYADYFKLKPGKCKIEDTSENEVKLTFQKW